MSPSGDAFFLGYVVLTLFLPCWTLSCPMERRHKGCVCHRWISGPQHGPTKAQKHSAGVYGPSGHGGSEHCPVWLDECPRPRAGGWDMILHLCAPQGTYGSGCHPSCHKALGEELLASSIWSGRDASMQRTVSKVNSAECEKHTCSACHRIRGGRRRGSRSLLNAAAAPG